MVGCVRGVVTLCLCNTCADKELAEREAAADPTVMPGFPLLLDWVSSAVMHTAVGLAPPSQEQRLPSLTPPDDGGMWLVGPLRADE